ncbi:MAG TPA: molybdopterin-dependent oxidoreductase [Tissierellia bacterium]|nr:molybdopterin-dependent oxidoreductase [Tissierellia bacterium]
MNIKKAVPIAAIIVILLVFLLTREEEVTLRIVNGDDVKTIKGEYIYSFEDSVTFPAVIRSSGEKPVETEYKGIELEKLFSALGIDISSAERITFNASDGYRVILKVEEINEPNNVYLTYERDGKPMKSKKRGGDGPLRLVIRRDPFSERWIKHVEEIIIE